MLFQNKLDRARELQRKIRGLDDEKDEKDAVSAEEEEVPAPDESPENEVPDVSEEQSAPRFKLFRRKKRGDKLDLEKGDVTAMMLSAFITLFIPAAIVLIVLAVIVIAVFRLF